MRAGNTALVLRSVPILSRRSLFLSALLAAAAALLLYGLLPGGNGARAAVAASPTRGVVNVDTYLGYEHGAAAGTGIALTSSGEVLTNNHVIRGATRIRVTDPSTGRTYTATVVGYSVSGDIALLKLSNASGLATATIGSANGVHTGDEVTAVGNAGGQGGTPTVTTGTVTALHRSITVSDDQGGTARLTDLIRTNAHLEPGDSGGPLLDGSGRVIGIDTAASSGFAFRGGGGSGGVGFAIPIDRAGSIVKTIEARRSTATVHVGPTSFLGISVSQLDRRGGSSSNGALVAGVLSGSPADQAGLGAGDLITSVAGHSVSSPTALVNALLRTSPGNPLLVHWTDRFGDTHSATVRPIAGPPQ